MKIKTTLTQNLSRILLGLFMLVAGVAHLTFKRIQFQAQMPQWLTQEPKMVNFVVLGSGVVEIVLGLAIIFLIQHKLKIGILLAVFFVLVFPGNIAQYSNNIDSFGLDTDRKRLSRLFFQPLLMLWALWSTGVLSAWFKSEKANSIQDLYTLNAKLINGETISLREFKGQTILIVNTASKCGLTPQYEGLEALYQKYQSKGFVVLGFPCNQFAKQEAGSNSEIATFCQKNYGVSFPIFEKVAVNGSLTHPIFNLLKSQLGGFWGSKIKWNFTKFLVDKNGVPVKRFAPTTKPKDLERFIEEII